MMWTTEPMKWAVVFGFLFLLAGVRPVEAASWDLGGITGEAVVDSSAQCSYARVSLGTDTPDQPENVALVELLLHANLSPGEEVELWVVAATGGLPWGEGGGGGVRSDRWIADEATGTLIRFDVTRHVRPAWLGEADAPVFLVRRGPDEEGVWESLDLLESPNYRVRVHGGH